MKKHLGFHHINTWKSFLAVFLILAFGGAGLAYSYETYPQILKTELSLEKNADVFFDESVEIIFSNPVSRITQLK